ncbi:hypothetical protein PQX77_019529 [Marasmius sp. AFHP31]|nr:hypothetical protein PQX77_019529 [Marasmius sp. AFHP31]
MFIRNPCDDLDLYRSFNAVRTPGEATTNTPVTNHLHNSQPSPTTTPVPPRGGVTDAPASTMMNMAVPAPLSSAESTNVPVSNLFYHSQPPPVATPVLPPGIAETIANTANSPVPMPAPATEATKNRREVTRKRNRCKDNSSSSTQNLARKAFIEEQGRTGNVAYDDDFTAWFNDLTDGRKEDFREESRGATLAKRAVTVQRKKGQGNVVPVEPLSTLPAEQSTLFTGANGWTIMTSVVNHGFNLSSSDGGADILQWRKAGNEPNDSRPL